MGSGCGWYPPLVRNELMVGVVLSAHHLAHNTPANMAAIQFNDIFSKLSSLFYGLSMVINHNMYKGRIYFLGTLLQKQISSRYNSLF